MTKERLYLYDTTLRDGQQTQGVQFALEEKIAIARMLDEVGVDYIEGGWPGANPTDSDFFERAPKKLAPKLAAFGMTKRAGRSAENDDVLATVINAGTGIVCLVGKAHDFQVETALNISLDENLENISKSIAHVVSEGREAIFDAEHFFDGCKANPDYSSRCLKAAYEAGAKWIVLCDTNGGTLPSEIGELTRRAIKAGIPGECVGIHTHNDTENAVAGALAAVDAGARQIQGTLNGLGERCGNANLVSIIPTILLKEPYRSRFETGIRPDGLKSLTRLSRSLDDILNRVPNKAAAYVGASAFVHKAGLHASGVNRNPATYEHVDPDSVGNRRVIPMSNQAGRSNLAARLADAGIEVDPSDSRLSRIIEEVKSREDRGYSYDTAQASFEVLARKMLGMLPEFFSVERYRLMVQRTGRSRADRTTQSEAVVVLDVGGERKLTVSEGLDKSGRDSGPVHALARAIAKDLGPYQSYVDAMRLVDFKVRITGSGTDAVTRVIIDCEDASGHRWSTVGVSPNILDSSFEALIDAIVWKLSKENAPGQ